jgi:hypothetical protein
MDHEEEYTVTPLIRYESTDEPLHTDEHPYCGDWDCYCMSAGPVQYGLQRIVETLGIRQSIYQEGVWT